MVVVVEEGQEEEGEDMAEKLLPSDVVEHAEFTFTLQEL